MTPVEVADILDQLHGDLTRSVSMLEEPIRTKVKDWQTGIYINFVPAAIQSDKQIRELWSMYINDETISNIILVSTSRLRAKYSLFGDRWYKFCELLSDAISPTSSAEDYLRAQGTYDRSTEGMGKSISSLDSTLKDRSFTPEEWHKVLYYNPWLTYYCCVVLAPMVLPEP